MLRDHKFDVVNPNVIRICGSERGPHEGERFDTIKEIMDILQLKDPPSKLRFSQTLSSKVTPAEDSEIFYMEGLCETPIKIIRVPVKGVVADLDVDLLLNPGGTHTKMRSGDKIVKEGHIPELEK